MGTTVGFPDLSAVFSAVIDTATKAIRFPSEVLQSVTDDRERFTPEVTAAAGLGQTERDETWQERDALTSQVSSVEYSEHAIVDDDPFDAMSHAEIFDHVQRMKPETLNAIADSWKVIAERTDSGINQFQQTISTAIGEGWQGKGGSAALGAVLAYAENGNQLKTRVKLISNKVDEARIVLDQVKRSIPEPDGASMFESLISFIPGATRNQAQHEAEEAERRARQVMKDVYLPNIRRADDQVPVLPAAFNPITGEGGGNGYTGGGSGQGTSGGSGSGGGLNPYSFSDGNAGGSGNSGVAAGGNPGQGTSGQDVLGQGYENGTLADSRTTFGDSGFGDSTQGNSNNVGAGGASDGSGGTGTSYPDGVAETTAASAATPSALTGANPAGGTSGVPQTGAFGAGGASASSGVGAGSGTSVGSGWGSGGGALGSGGPGGALAAGGRGALAGGSGSGVGGSGVGGSGNNAARTPMMGGMGGMAGGRGQGQGDDDTHQTPGFLINVDNGNTLIGELPMVTPAVLGE